MSAPTSDAHWLGNASVAPPIRYRGMSVQSVYVDAPGGRLAVEVFLPDAPQSEKLPTMLHMTRYYRNWTFKKSSGALSSFLCCCCCGLLPKKLKMHGIPGVTHNSHWNMRSVAFAEQFVPRGFAWISVDVLGTGASEGTRPIDFTELEIEGLKCVAEWVVGQPWSNGRIATTGISYDGMTGLFLSSFALPSVVAIAPLFAPFDGYSELSHPGGVRCVGFTREYSDFVFKLDRGQINQCNFPPLLKRIIRLCIAGVRPVGTNSELQKILQQHQANWNVLDLQMKGMNRDDTVEISDGTSPVADFVFPVKRAAAITDPNGPRRLFVSGWYDSGTAVGAVRMFLTCVNRIRQQQQRKNSSSNGDELANTDKLPRLLLGPWNHGARNHCVPGQTQKIRSLAQFPIQLEVLNFVQPFVSTNSATTVSADQPKPVTYFTVNEGVWKHSATWPPTDCTSIRLVLGAQNTLKQDTDGISNCNASFDLDDSLREREIQANQKRRASNGLTAQTTTTYTINPNASSGEMSRWNLIKHIMLFPITYADRAAADALCVLFESDTTPLGQSGAFEITGHPHVTLWVAADANDFALFVYLEEVLPTGEVIYITEGQLRASHRRLCADGNALPFDDVFPHRTFVTKDMLPVAENEPVKCEVFFHPISYLVRAGSRLRLAIAATDAFNFSPLPLEKQPTKLEIVHDRHVGMISSLTLPIADKVAL